MRVSRVSTVQTGQTDAPCIEIVHDIDQMARSYTTQRRTSAMCYYPSHKTLLNDYLDAEAIGHRT
jgi:hypothetical protein